MIDNKSALEIFPNPSNGNISIKSSKSISKIEIKSIAGQIVYEENSLNLVEKTFSLNLAKGIYFVVSTNSNGLCYFEKLVIN
ncbi:MAG: T9SS type A sorting domain-containing protein [Bacteroidetes bacterium]|nr:T9SS type A sorting domain-containing protein [Bacteroidota bacterium]